MRPILFELFGIPIPGYGLTLVISFIISWVFLRREANRLGMDGEKVGDTAVMALLFGLVGAKLLLILVDLPEYLSDPRRILGTLRSAGVIYGGLIGGTLGGLWYMKRHALPIWKTLDVMAPFAALGVGLGRVCCILAGCCFGFPYDGPFALVYPSHPLCEAPAGVGLFPVQVVGIVTGISLCIFLVYLLRNHYRFQGQIVLSYMFLYGLLRGLNEFLRGDTVRGLWFGDTISTSQLISLAGMILAVVLYQKLRKGAKP